MTKIHNNALELPELAAPPAAPDAGRRKLYLGDDGAWYSVGSDGVPDPLKKSNPVVIVNSSGNGDFDTLQAGVDHASSVGADVLLVSDYSVTHNLEVTNSVTIHLIGEAKLLLTKTAAPYQTVTFIGGEWDFLETAISQPIKVSLLDARIKSIKHTYQSGLVLKIMNCSGADQNFIPGWVKVEDENYNEPTVIIEHSDLKGVDLVIDTDWMGSLMLSHCVLADVSFLKTFGFAYQLHDNVYIFSVLMRTLSTHSAMVLPISHCSFSEIPVNASPPTGNYSNTVAGVTWPALS